MNRQTKFQRDQIGFRQTYRQKQKLTDKFKNKQINRKTHPWVNRQRDRLKDDRADRQMDRRNKETGQKQNGKTKNRQVLVSITIIFCVGYKIKNLFFVSKWFWIRIFKRELFFIWCFSSLGTLIWWTKARKILNKYWISIFQKETFLIPSFFGAVVSSRVTLSRGKVSRGNIACRKVSRRIEPLHRFI